MLMLISITQTTKLIVPTNKTKSILRVLQKKQRMISMILVSWMVKASVGVTTNQ